MRLELEAYDGLGALLLGRAEVSYTHGLGEQADAVELAVASMAAGESCDVRCHWRPGLQGGESLPRDPWLPVSYRLRLLAVGAPLEPPGGLDPAARLAAAGALRNAAADLRRRGRHLLARERYCAVLAAVGPVPPAAADARQRRAATGLRRHCLLHAGDCELRLRMWGAALASAEALEKECGPSAAALMLRGQALLTTDPPAARADFERALALEPASERAGRLLRLAEAGERRQRRAARWFDGDGVEARSAAASDPEVCAQCGRLGRGGRRAEDGSKFAGQHFCEECWECWGRIRRSQQRELDRRVDKAFALDR